MNKTIVCNYIGKKGGGPLYAYEMTRGLIQNGVNVIAILPDNIENLAMWKELHGCEVILIKGYSDNYFSLALAALRVILWERRKIRRVCVRANAECVYIPMIQTFSMLINSCVKSKKCIVTIHDPRPHKGTSKLYAYINKQTAMRADDIVILTEQFKQYTAECYSKETSRVHVIPHGIFDRYRDVYVPEYKHEYEQDRINFLFFGRITEYKGLDVLAQAYSRLSDDYPNVALTIVGNGDFSPYKAQFDTLNNVTVVNRWIKDEEVYGYFNTPGVVTVLPYIEATQSGVIPVAMACESFVITSDCGGLSEQVENGVTGRLVTAGSVDELYGAMKQVVDNGVDERIVINAREHVESLSWGKLALRLCKIIER